PGTRGRQPWSVHLGRERRLSLPPAPHQRLGTRRGPRTGGSRLNWFTTLSQPSALDREDERRLLARVEAHAEARASPVLLGVAEQVHDPERLVRPDPQDLEREP